MLGTRRYRHHWRSEITRLSMQSRMKPGQIVYKLPALSNDGQGSISPDIKRASSDKDGEITGLD